MSTLENLKKMTGNAGKDNPEAGENNVVAGQNNTDSEENNSGMSTSQSENVGAETKQGKDGTTVQQDGGTLPEVNVAAPKKKADKSSNYEQKASAIADKLAGQKANTKAPNYEAIPEPPKRPMSMEEMYKKLHPEMSPDEQEKKSRRERIENLFNGISDAISAISALRATSKGALNTFYADNTLSARQKQRMDEWQKKVAEYNKGVYEAQAKDAENADKNYRTRLEYINAKNGLEDKLADFNLKLEDFTRDGLKAAMQAYLDLEHKKITQEQFEKRMKETVRHNKETEQTGRERLAVARENAQTSRDRLNHQVSKDSDTDASNSITVYDPKTNEPVTFSKKKDGANYIQKAGEWLRSHGEKFEKDVKENGVVTGSVDNPNPSESEIKNRAARYKKRIKVNIGIK